MTQTRFFTSCCVFAAAFFFFAAQYALASEPKLVASHGAWDAFVFSESGKSVCYMAAKPDKDQGDYQKRGEIYALITHRPAEGSKNVFSYVAGYGYKPGSEATIDIDGKKFTLFTQDDTAWAPDAETDEDIANAIRSGTKMIVRGMSSRGTKTTDTFSLRGSSAAHDRIGKDCRR